MKRRNRTPLFWLALMVTVISPLVPAACPAQTPTLTPSSKPHTQVVLLGTGNPSADPDRMGPSVAIVVNDVPYIVDCGPGVVRRASAAFHKGVVGLAVPKLKTAFITHLHSDHTVGYPDLILSPWVLGRKDALEVYGPTGLKAMTDHLLAAYSEDIDIRINGLEHGNTTGYKVNAHEIKPGVVYKDDNVTVKAFPVHHGSWKEAYGYRFETPDKVIVISGDCSPSPSVIENCNGCDVLLHEVYTQTGYCAESASSGSTRRKTSPNWRRKRSRSFSCFTTKCSSAARRIPKKDCYKRYVSATPAKSSPLTTSTFIRSVVCSADFADWRR